MSTPLLVAPLFIVGLGGRTGRWAVAYCSRRGPDIFDRPKQEITPAIFCIYPDALRNQYSIAYDFSLRALRALLILNNSKILPYPVIILKFIC